MSQVPLQKKCIDFANVLKAFIGCSYLSMPFAFHQSGIVLGIIILLVVGWLNDYGCVQIVKCKDIIVSKLVEKFESNYQLGLLPRPEAELVSRGQLKSKLEDRITISHIAKYAFGKKAQWIVTICLFLSQFGFCTGYIIFVGNTLVELINFLTSYTNNTGNITLWSENTLVTKVEIKHLLIYMLIAPTPIYILFALLRTIRKMGWISMFANIAIGLGYIIVMAILINGFSMTTNIRLFNFESAAVTFGMLTAVFEGIGTVIPIETSMIGNRQNLFPYLHVTISLIMCMLGGFGILGYLRYGPSTPQIILRNLPQNVFLAVVNVILIISVTCTYPLQMFPVVEVVEFLFFRMRSAQFVEDRKQILLNHEINMNPSDFGNVQDDLLVELCSDNDDESEYIINNVPNTYGSTGTNIPTLSDNPDLHIDNVYSKKELRMIRIIHSNNIDAPAWKRNLIRIFIYFMQLALAIGMRDNFGYLVAFIGAIGSSILCFILPAATYLKLTRSTGRKWYWNLSSLLIILFGIIGSILSLVVTIRDIISKS